MIVPEDMKIRRLTPTECERLQGFPDGWTEGVSDTQRYKCLGNAVTVNVIEAIVKQMRRENVMNKNAIDYWYPKIKELVPTPETTIIPIKWNWDKTGNYLEISDEYLNAIEEASKHFDFPLFMRGSDSSIKHSWNDTCFVRLPERLKTHIVRIVNETMCLDMISSVPCDSIALREYIPMNGAFKAFWGGLPINSERRYFINEGKVLCRHIYWEEENIGQHPKGLPSNWRELLAKINSETDEEVALLTDYASKIGGAFDDYWSIDFCKSKSGKWYCIDMAEGNKSWHPECKTKP